MQHIAILGEIGVGNLGDDLGYLLLKREIEKNFEKRGKFCQVDYLRTSRFSELNYIGYSAVVLGAGTLLDAANGDYIQAIHKAQERGILTAILGTGISDKRHIPDTEDGKKLLTKIIEKAKNVYFRGVDGPDLLWVLGNHEYDGPKEGVGFNLGFAAYSTIDLVKIHEQIKAVKLFLEAQGIKTSWVSCWDRDNDLMDEPSIMVDGSRKSLEELSKLKAIVPFRGHLGTVAACCGVRVYPVCYSQKIKPMYEGVIEPEWLECEGKKWTQIVSDTWHLPVDYKPNIEKAQQEVKKQSEDFAGNLAEGR